MLFYLLIILIVIAALFLFIYQRRQRKKPKFKKRVPIVNLGSSKLLNRKKVDNSGSRDPEMDSSEHSPYDPNYIILQLNAFPGKPYMGYELHQALLSVGLRFGDKNIFHRYRDHYENKVLFSLAAATSRGSFNTEDIGSFRCNGLLLFMHLDPKRKLMKSFDLMLDTARQLTEELGGEIYDDLQGLINAESIKRMRERICVVETNNLYAADLLDNLD